MRQTLTDSRQDATVLAGLQEGLDLMNRDTELYSEAQASLTIAARESARRLVADLERLESGLKTDA
ncbi:hypothetical protein [Roseovarius sp.]|uniref:hypothetical protein n=1 Tax=Roseovarius sp. TaxID=1486281 RepID=UPI003A96CC31